MNKIKIFLSLGLAGLFLCGCTTVSKPNSDGDKPSHQHTYSDTWSFDSTYHWHAATCEHTSELKDKEEHVFSDWVIDVEATEQEKGLKHKECVYCQYLVSEEIEVLEIQQRSDTKHNTQESQPVRLLLRFSRSNSFAQIIEDDCCTE